MADLYAAEIDGYAIDCKTLEDGFEKALALVEYPWRDGAQTEDMGLRARWIRIRCYWLEERYAEHVAFLEHLKSRELFEFFHPKYGLAQGRIEAVVVRHDERQECAEVDLAFVEDMLSQEEPILYPDVGAAADEAFITGQTELMESFAAQARETLGAEAVDILNRALDPALGIVAQFSGVTTAARNWLKGVERYVLTLQAAATDVVNPANALLAMIDYGANLPGRVIGPLAMVFERYARLNDSLRAAPDRYMANLQNHIDALAAAAQDFAGQTRTAGAQRMALEEQVRNRVRQRELAQTSFDMEGNFFPAADVGQVLTVRELDLSLAAARTAIQAAIDADRSQQSLKTLARTLLDHVAIVKLERDRIARILLDNPMPLHLVCLMRGLPYAYAERILAINDIAHPNFAAGEVDVYAR